MTRPLQTWERKESLQPLFCPMKLVEEKAEHCVRWKLERNNKFELHTGHPLFIWWKQLVKSYFRFWRTYTVCLSSEQLSFTLKAKLELLPELYLKILELSTEEDIVAETETANLFQNEGTLILWLLGWMQCYLSHLQLKCNLSHLLQMSQTLKTDKPKW